MLIMDKLEQLEKNLGKNQEKVIKVKEVIKLDSEGLYIFGKRILKWRSKK